MFLAIVESPHISSHLIFPFHFVHLHRHSCLPCIKIFQTFLGERIAQVLWWIFNHIQLFRHETKIWKTKFRLTSFSLSFGTFSKTSFFRETFFPVCWIEKFSMWDQNLTIVLHLQDISCLLGRMDGKKAFLHTELFARKFFSKLYMTLQNKRLSLLLTNKHWVKLNFPSYRIWRIRSHDWTWKVKPCKITWLD